MDNGSVMEQLVKSLSFEVEAIPQDNIIQLTTSSKSAPLNVKIRVRKKEEAGFQHGVLSLPKPDKADRVPQRIRLVSSDQTIMSFNVIMEADFQKTIKKPRKNILSIFKPTTCLGAKNEDEENYAYIPNATYKADIVEEHTSKSEAALTIFTLKKNEDNAETSKSFPKKKNKDIFGECKPGGCLDPPFGEDRYKYSPALLNEQTGTSGNNTKVPERTLGQVSDKKTRTNSILSYKLFHWKRNHSNDEALDKNVIKNKPKSESVLELYQAGALQSTSTNYHSIMTYPSTLTSSEPRIREEKQRGSRIYNEASKSSINIDSGSYFMKPKKKKNFDDINNTVKVNNNVNIGDAKVDTANTKTELNVIAQRQDVNYGNKNDLKAKDSVTDVRGAQEVIIGSADGKTRAFKQDSEEILILVKENELSSNKKSSESFVSIFIPLLKKTDSIYSRTVLPKMNEASMKTLKNTKLISDKPADIESLCATIHFDENVRDKSLIFNTETDILTSSPNKKIISDKPADIEIIPLRVAKSTKENEKVQNTETDVLTSLLTKNLGSDEPAGTETLPLCAALNNNGNMKDIDQIANHNLKDTRQRFINIKEKYEISSNEKGTSNQKPIEKVTTNNIYIPLLKKPKSMESKNIISDIREDPKKIQSKETYILSALPVDKKGISEIPTEIEAKPVRAAHDNDTIIENMNRMQNFNEMDTEPLPKDIEERKIKDPEQQNFITQSSTKETLICQATEFINQNRWLEEPITIQSKYKTSTQTHTDSDIGVKKSTVSIDDSDKPKSEPIIFLKSESITSIKRNPVKEGILKDYQKPSLVKDREFKKNNETKNIPSIQNIEESNSVLKNKVQIIETDVLTSLLTKNLGSDKPASTETLPLRAALNKNGNMKDIDQIANHNLKDTRQRFINIKEKYEISCNEKENLYASSQKPIEKGTTNNIYIPLLKKPKSMESKNIISDISEGPKKIQCKETDILSTLPVNKKGISEIPTEIEAKPVHVAHDNDTIIENINRMQNFNEMDTEPLPKYIEKRKIKDPEQQNFITQSSTKETLICQATDFINQNRWLEEPINLQSKYKTSTQTHTDSDIGVKKSTVSFDDSDKPKNEPIIFLKSESITSIKRNSVKEGILKDYQKHSLVNDREFKKNDEVKNIPSIQNVEENNSVSKSVLTIGANDEMSIYDITALNSDDKITLQDKNRMTSRDIKDYGSTNIAMPIKTDTPLEIIKIDDDLQYIWKNTAHLLQSDTKLHTENERLASYSKINITLDEIGGKEIDIDMKRPMSICGKQNVNDDKNQYLDKSNEQSIVVSTEANSDTPNKQHKKSIVRSTDSQDIVIDSKGILSQAKNMNKNCQNDETESQKIEDILSNRQASISLIIGEFDKNTDTPVQPLEVTTELTQNKAASQNIFIESKEIITGNIVDDDVLSKLSILTDNEIPFNFIYFDDENNDLDQNKLDTGQRQSYEEQRKYDPIHHYDMENCTLQEPYENKYSPPTACITRKADNVKFEDESMADKDNETTFISHIVIDSYSKPDFDSDSKRDLTSMYPHTNLDLNKQRKKMYPGSKADGKIAYPKSDSTIYLKPNSVYTETALEITGIDRHFSDEHSLSQAQTPEATANASPFKINLAIQSYIDDTNQKHIKSFDPDIAPKRSHMDTISVIKRFIELDDKIKLPIDSENDIYIQIKTRTQKDATAVGGHMRPAINKESIIDSKLVDDPINRNIIIAEDIRRTLIAVYEEELLPLRNTISELKDNIEMLTSQQMTIKGRAFAKKTKSTRIVPLFRKCACLRR